MPVLSLHGHSVCSLKKKVHRNCKGNNELLSQERVSLQVVLTVASTPLKPRGQASCLPPRPQKELGDVRLCVSVCDVNIDDHVDLALP
eukprot:13138912-Ditylum_brightwellii.AAC.1